MDSETILLHLRILTFSVLIAIALAKLEIQIEGKNGWAEELPTWRIKNKLTRIFWGQQPYTGYHFWLLVLSMVFLHFPFFIVPELWSIKMEILILAYFLVGSIIEDYLWFGFNPNYGWKKFNNTHAPWHRGWFFKIPELYIKLGSLAALLILIASYL